jgi:hypothetical protein
MKEESPKSAKLIMEFEQVNEDKDSENDDLDGLEEDDGWGSDPLQLPDDDDEIVISEGTNEHDDLVLE